MNNQDSNINNPFEIIIGIVSPLGTNRKQFIKKLKRKFENTGYKFIEISITELIFGNKKLEIQSLEYYVKMQICSVLRDQYTNGLLTEPVINKIKSMRTTYKKGDKVVYLVDQLKNDSEYKIFSYIYGLNYIQVSLFSKQEKRDEYLKNKFKDEKIPEERTIVLKQISNWMKQISDKNSFIKDIIDIDKVVNDYYQEILPDTSHNLMEKDFSEIDPNFIEKNQGNSCPNFFINHITS